MSLRNGDFIVTHTGRYVWPLDPWPEDIVLEDIAHSLAIVNRWGGHTDVPYSVAQHSVLVASYVDKENALWGLLHEASEAYLSDIVSPAKKDMPEYKVHEERLMKAAAEKFALPWPIPENVHDIDRKIRVDEAVGLFSCDTMKRQFCHSPRLGIPIYPWSWEHAKYRFLQFYKMLTDVKDE